MENKTIISVPHIGQDYGKVQVKYPDGDVAEYEVDLYLARALRQHHGEKDLELEEEEA